MRIRSAITRRRVVLVLCVLGLKSAAVFAGARVMTTGREARYADAHRAAVAALDAAADVDAARWAPTVFFEAEGAFRAAERAARLARTSIVPDFSSAYVHLEQVVAAAVRARDTAILVKAEAHAAAEDALAMARTAAAGAASMAATIDLGWRRRADAARSRLVLRQAELFYRDGEYEHTRVRAIEARRLALDVSGHATVIAARYTNADLVARWRRWADETVRWSQQTGRAAIVVSKADHRLTLYVAGRTVATYAADLGYNWVVDKTFAGDGATPEGRYRITLKKDRGASTYYKALLLDYPNEADRGRFTDGRGAGTIPASAAIGGLIEVHGEGGRGEDWTRGCVALRNADIDALFPQVEVGTPVTIIGSDEPRSVVDLLPPVPSPLRQQRPRPARRAGRGARARGGGPPRALKHDGEGQSEGAGVGASRVGIGGEP